MDMSVSSLHIPPGAVLVGYKRRYFLGPYRVYNGTSVTLYAWNNRIRSVMVLPATSPLPPQPTTALSSTVNNASAYVRFYAKANYDILSLEESVAEGGVPSLEDWPFDLVDIMPRSISLDPGVVLIQYNETNFQGERRFWNRSNPSMPEDATRFLMRSFKVMNASAAATEANQTDYAVCAANINSSKVDLYIQAGDTIPDMAVFASTAGCSPLTLSPTVFVTVYADVNYSGAATTYNATTTAIMQLKGSMIVRATTSSPVVLELASGKTMWSAVGAVVGAAFLTFVVYRWMARVRVAKNDTTTRLAGSTRSHLPSARPRSSIPSQDMDWGDLALIRLDSCQVVRERFVASGASGVVYSGTFQISTPVAIKELHVYTATSVQRFIRELNLLSSIESPHIVKLIGATWTCPSDLHAVFELMGGGDLHSYLCQTRRDQVAWSTRLHWTKSVAEGLFYLHSMQHMHRDLKSRNLLLSTDVSSLKVADFGTVRDVDDSTHTANVGTYRWMAPEMLAFQPYTNSVDVYAFGVVMSEIETHQTPYANLFMSTGGSATKHPFESHVLRRVLHENLRPTFSPDCPIWYKFLALRCMAENPADRPSTAEILHVLTMQQREMDESKHDDEE
ncbi:hypothetical protein DYB32_010173 [Aphanomyces invadans]|uniref:Protein kinase domain-containing protein n=1 Tax=Aphanomyces invadans TaxID=157072 RepID=A0A3R7CT70_9STRA|nr:hypothetical protein DYB32_010173 [Aphanomyces invadans]